ncbi:MAG: hypothetical protein LBR55_04305 [Bacteroidales bacterium]|jgi:hypothetical protein|nr:hypothetical protein [Bacteroidales bacterium]
MKKLFLLTPIAALLITSACNNTTKPAGATSINQQNETIATPAKETNPVVINDTMNGLSDRKTYTIEAEKGQTLSANIVTPSDTANIRIDQIISPSGQGDGPFGKDIMTYDISESGTWQVIVAGSMMQGEDYKGKFTLTLAVK